MASTKSLQLVLSIGIILSPTVGFLDTARMMLQIRRPDAYDFDMVMLINVAQSMKVLYYFYDPYAVELLGQSISLLVMTSFLSYLRFHFTNADMILSVKALGTPQLHRILDIRKNQSFPEYMLSLTTYWALGYIFFLLTIVLLGTKASVEGLAYVSSMIESLATFPVFMRVVLKAEPSTVSPVLIAQYVVGDIMKIGLFIFYTSPWAFVFGASCQLIMDTISACRYLYLVKFKYGLDLSENVYCIMPHNTTDSGSPIFDVDDNLS